MDKSQPNPQQTHATLDTKTLRVELAALDEQAEGLIARMNILITQSAHTVTDPDQYDADHADLERKYQKADTKRIKTAEAIKDRETRRHQASQVHNYLHTRQPLAYTPQAWNTLVEEATVNTDGSIAIRFKDEPAA